MSGLQVGYCTNVHAGADLNATWMNLRKYAVPVKRQCRPDGVLGIGLWLSAASAQQLRADHRIDELADWLASQGLLPFTFNGFPYGDFHQPIVKHRVYQPDWASPLRRDYTLALVAILDRLLPSGLPGSISTLPLGWPTSRSDSSAEGQAAVHLREVADELARLESDTGRVIRLAIEPEPGCLLSGSKDLARFFEEVLFQEGNEPVLRRYLGVCHDVCHAAVIFEAQEDALATYQKAGIQVVKVQVSSGIHVAFGKMSPRQREEAVEQLRAFAEDRYLHQTYIRSQGSQSPSHVDYFEDLPMALAECGRAVDIESQWRIHFHLPIFLERFGQLETTRDEILACYLAARAQGVEHFEIETYAWSVLPGELQVDDLSNGIAREMQWFDQRIAAPRG